MPYSLVHRCRVRENNLSLLGSRVRRHQRWRRRTSRYKAKWKVKRRSRRINEFLAPLPSGQSVWNRYRRIDRGFLGTASTSFLPHASLGCVPEEVLDEFVCDRGRMFLAAPRLMERFNSLSLEEGAQKTVARLNLCQNIYSLDKNNPRKRHTFKSCPLVWDTGASFGLTPFRQDFIDYTECSISVNDIARTNTVIGIGTTLHKFKVDGEDIFLACLSYHLPSADVRLFSPQTFHTLYGGHSTVQGDRVDMFIDSLRVGVGIDREASNVPMECRWFRIVGFHRRR